MHAPCRVQVGYRKNRYLAYGAGTELLKPPNSDESLIDVAIGDSLQTRLVGRIFT
jgi:hypothetical protein